MRIIFITYKTSIEKLSLLERIFTLKKLECRKNKMIAIKKKLVMTLQSENISCFYGKSPKFALHEFQQWNISVNDEWHFFK